MREWGRKSTFAVTQGEDGHTRIRPGERFTQVESACTCNDVVPWCSCRGAEGVIGVPSRAPGEPSRRAAEPSQVAGAEPSRVDRSRPERGPGALCHWCRENEIPKLGPTGLATRSDALTCSKACRQKRARFNRGARPATLRAVAEPQPSRPDSERSMRFAYADPPYPGFAYLYEGHPDYAGEVDHAELLDRLLADYPDGWALSTSSKTLAYVLALCTERGIGASSGPKPFQSAVRIGAWTRPLPPRRSRRPFTAWEPVLVYGGRPVLNVGLLDWVHAAQPRDYPGRLVGIKPAAFSAFVFDALGAQPGDDLDDLFPGSGAVARAWEAYVSPIEHGSAVAPVAERSRRGSTGGRAARPVVQDLRDTSPVDERPVAPAAPPVASLGDGRDGSTGPESPVQRTDSRPFEGPDLDATPASPLSPPSPKNASAAGPIEPEVPHV